ncbi:DegT/DnrJ/EryC1/StrS family aminotransferase [Candidatus Pelagibacter ubique]|nr:DegT/DnrJ/EryC1/StrS family aminotransferase [Candidatus Pelagibacter ubique]
MHVPVFDLKTYNSKIRNDLHRSLEKILKSGILFLGPEVEKFEKKVCKFLNMKYSVAVSSGSSALFLALKASGIKKGDEVITTPLTWIITANAIKAVGAIPRFADVRDDFNIDPESILKNINKKTKAIVPMHYAGLLCDMKKIKKIAKENKLLLIEDAAQSWNASASGQKSGTFSNVSAFSMNPMKPLGGYGENGVVVTNNKKIYKKLLILRHAGTNSKKKFITNDSKVVSLNHKMDEINASFLNVAIKHFKSKHSKKEIIAKYLYQKLDGKIKTQIPQKNSIHARYVFPIRYKFRDELMNYLNKNKIETKIMNQPLASKAEIYKDAHSHTPNAEKILNESLIIPSHENLSIKQLDYMIAKINSFVNKKNLVKS